MFLHERNQFVSLSPLSILDRSTWGAKVVLFLWYSKTVSGRYSIADRGLDCLKRAC